MEQLAPDFLEPSAVSLMEQDIAQLVRFGPAIFRPLSFHEATRLSSQVPASTPSY
jgi:hypothetical protein